MWNSETFFFSPDLDFNRILSFIITNLVSMCFMSYLRYLFLVVWILTKKLFFSCLNCLDINLILLFLSFEFNDFTLPSHSRNDG